MNRYRTLISGTLLALFAAAGAGLVAFTYEQTADRIAANEREALLKSLTALVPAKSIDNDIITDLIRVSDPELLGSDSTTVYRGRRQQRPVAAVLTPAAPDGYSGPIRLLVAIHYDGTLAGVRVVSHKETPGLGDRIEEEKSDWIYGFAGKSLDNPSLGQWKVKRDGGVFDQFTGATITPRVIVRTVKNTLVYFQQNREALFKPVTSVPTDLAGND
ncbi:electron transport complex subunit RsxG [Pseudomonadota bacterium]